MIVESQRLDAMAKHSQGMQDREGLNLAPALSRHLDLKYLARVDTQHSLSLASCGCRYGRRLGGRGVKQLGGVENARTRCEIAATYWSPQIFPESCTQVSYS